ncbi:MAG TPA: class I SAM-dependent methyltransferase [Thermoanaerobaculia bacterium]
MDPHYAQNYRDLYERHWWWRAREDLILATLASLRPNGRWGAILDVGCGDGLFFDKLSGLGEVEGIEMDPKGVTPGGRWIDRIHVRPFDESFRPGKRFDLVLMLDVIEHFEEPLASVRRAIELLAPEGYLVVTVPAFESLWTSHDELNHHFTRYTKGGLAALIREAGGELHQSRYFYRWMYPLKLAAHVKETVFPVSPEIPSVPPSWLNDVLYRLSRWEQKTIGSWPLPFGSSLLAVCGPLPARR